MTHPVFDMEFGEKVIDYHLSLQGKWKLPKGFELIFPFENVSTRHAFSLFYRKYFNDQNNRTFLFGINPGRFGAGITGIPFTDPQILDNICGIENPFQKRNELSAIFIYKMIEELGGPVEFYSRFYITSVCHLGFIKDKKNINYYDDSMLQKRVKPKIIQNIKTQMAFGANRKVAFSIGQGKNFKFLQEINQKHKFFDRVLPLPHPRWVMQYKRKTMQVYLDEYALALNDVSH